MCGENQVLVRHTQADRGSPPRVRGKQILASIQNAEKGITPACAGKTTAPPLIGVAFRDHPRVCGENGLGRVRRGNPEGSPPRVRGKQSDVRETSQCGRITPACAGKTSTRTPACSRGRDHPRVCGENVLPLSFSRRRRGSPPRVRGKQGFRFKFNEKARITPACAGKTGFCSTPAAPSRDHPRVCGENGGIL